MTTDRSKAVRLERREDALSFGRVARYLHLAARSRASARERGRDDPVDGEGRGFRPLLEYVLDQGRGEAKAAWVEGSARLSRPHGRRSHPGGVRLGRGWLH